MWKIVLEYGEMEIGSLYCFIDPAKAMYANSDVKLIHTKYLTMGDDHCAFARVPIMGRDRENFFGKERNWFHVEAGLDEFYKKKNKNSK